MTIETCNGSQLASAADRQALATSNAAKSLADARVRSAGRASGHAAKGMFAVRSILAPGNADISSAQRANSGRKLPACYPDRRVS